MHSKLLSLLALVATALAAPTAAPEITQVEWTVIDPAEVSLTPRAVEDISLAKRTVGGMYLCTDWHFMGNCGYAVQPLNQCIHLDSPWFHSVSSMGPDSGTVCDIYSDYSCNTLIFRDMRNPGSSDLGELGINDQMGSFKCRAG